MTSSAGEQGIIIEMIWGAWKTRTWSVAATAAVVPSRGAYLGKEPQGGQLEEDIVGRQDIVLAKGVARAHGRLALAQTAKHGRPVERREHPGELSALGRGALRAARGEELPRIALVQLDQDWDANASVWRRGGNAMCGDARAMALALLLGPRTGGGGACDRGGRCATEAMPETSAEAAAARRWRTEKDRCRQDDGKDDIWDLDGVFGQLDIEEVAAVAAARVYRVALFVRVRNRHGGKHKQVAARVERRGVEEEPLGKRLHPENQ